MPTLADMAYWSCVCCYDPITPNVFGKVLQIGDITVCVIQQPGKVVIIFPGSEQFVRDWVDHDLLAIPYGHPQLGTLHLGFWEGMEAVFTALKPMLQGVQVYLGGHSLGAARAADMAALSHLNNVEVKYLALFESPRVGCKTLSDMLPYCTRGYISTTNLLDPVPDVPFDPFTPPLPTTQLNCHPSGLSIVNPIDYHLGGLIYKGVQKLGFANFEV